MDTERAKIEQGSLEYNRLVEKLKPIYFSVKSDEYNKILTALCSGDIDRITDILLSAYRDRKEALMETIRVQAELFEAQLDVTMEKREVERLNIQLIESRQKEQDLQEEGRRCIRPPAHKDQLADETILTEYKKAKSLRAVAKALGCSHNTVKARLIKMGCIEK